MLRRSALELHAFAHRRWRHVVHQVPIDRPSAELPRNLTADLRVRAQHRRDTERDADMHAQDRGDRQ